MNKWMLMLSLLCMACASEKELCAPQQIIDHGGLSQSVGGVYISCELEPHFINLDSLFSCPVDLPIDSMFSDSWQYACTMDVVAVDSSVADFSFTYLNGAFELDLYDQSLSAADYAPLINGDTLHSGQYPVYGAYRLYRSTEVIELILVNRWIGGCFHDELVWRRTF